MPHKSGAGKSPKKSLFATFNKVIASAAKLM
jgi:hypothetical protein